MRCCSSLLHLLLFPPPPTMIGGALDATNVWAPSFDCTGGRMHTLTTLTLRPFAPFTVAGVLRRDPKSVQTEDLTLR